MEPIEPDSWKTWARGGWLLFQDAAIPLIAVQALWLLAMWALPTLWQVALGCFLGFWVSGFMLIVCGARDGETGIWIAWKLRRKGWAVSGLLVGSATLAVVSATFVALSAMNGTGGPQGKTFEATAYAVSTATYVWGCNAMVGWFVGLMVLLDMPMKKAVEACLLVGRRAKRPAIAFTLAVWAWITFCLLAPEVAIAASLLAIGWLHACLYVSIRHVFFDDPPKKRKARRAAPKASLQEAASGA